MLWRSARGASPSRSQKYICQRGAVPSHEGVFSVLSSRPREGSYVGAQRRTQLSVGPGERTRAKVGPFHHLKMLQH